MICLPMLFTVLYIYFWHLELSLDIGFYRTFVTHIPSETSQGKNVFAHQSDVQ